MTRPGATAAHGVGASAASWISICAASPGASVRGAAPPTYRSPGGASTVGVTLSGSAPGLLTSKAIAPASNASPSKSPAVDVTARASASTNARDSAVTTFSSKMPSNSRFAMRGPDSVIVTHTTWSNSPNNGPRRLPPPPVVPRVKYLRLLRTFFT